MTVNDLKNKFKVVLFAQYDENQSKAVLLENITQSISNPNDFAIADAEDDFNIAMHIVGNQIYVDGYNDGNKYWVFDVDYDHQNTKEFSKSDGFYYVQMPQVLNDPEGFALVEIDRTASKIKLAVGNDYTYPDAYYPNSQIIDISDAFNAATQADNSRDNNEAIAKLLLLVAQMEYVDLDGIDSAGLMNEFDEGPALSWNLYSDGNPHPMPGLIMTSRRVAITAQDIDSAGENGVLLCKFNRTPTVDELMNKLKIVWGTSEDIGTSEAQAEYDGDNVHFFFSCSSADVNIRISNNSVYVCTNGDNNPHIFDVDFDNQHQRELTVISNTDDVPKYITEPALLGVSAEGLVVNFYEDDDDPPSKSVTIYSNSEENAIRTFDDTTDQFNFTSPLPGLNASDLIVIMREVLMMEYSNGNGIDVEMAEWQNQDQDWLPIIRPFNLLTDSTAQLPA